MALTQSAQGGGASAAHPSSRSTAMGPSNNIITLLNSAAENQLGSYETSQRGSTEKNGCSMSSGEKNVTNTFCLPDCQCQEGPLLASLDDSSISPSAEYASLRNVSNILSAHTLPDVCEKNTENLGHPCLGKTFTLPDNRELPSEGDNLMMTTSPVIGPFENQSCLQMTILCEESPAHKSLASVNSEPSVYVHGTFTQEKCIDFEPVVSTIRDMDLTSTPVLNAGEKMLPHLKSSRTENACSPIFFPKKQQKTSATLSKNCVVGPSQYAQKNSKIEMNCSKSELRNAVSKVVTRTANDKIVSASSSKHKEQQTNAHSKCVERVRGAKMISPSKVRNSSAFLSVTNKKENNAQRRVNPSGTPLVCIFTAGIKSPLIPQCSKTSTETEQTTPCQATGSPAQGAGNQTFCSSFLEPPTDKSVQKDQKQTPKKTAANKIEVKSLSVLRQGKTQPRCSTECLLSSPRPPKERKTIPTFSTAVNIPRHEKQTKLTTTKNSSQSKLALESEDPREVTKIGLVAVSDKKGTASLENCRTPQQTFPNKPQGRFLAQTSVGSPRTATQPIRQRPRMNLGADNRVSRGVGTPPSNQNGTAATPPSKLPRKILVLSRSGNGGRIHSEGAAIVPTRSPTSTKTNKGAPTQVSLKRTQSSRRAPLTPIKPVDKNKPKTSSWQQLPSSPSKQNHGAPDVVPPCLPENDRNDQRIQNLGKLLAASNCRFEAVAIVLQQTLAERDEEAGQCRELSQELVNLRGELVSSVNSSQRLEKEKQDLQDALDSAMQRMQEQYQKDMEEMEQKLQLFYQAEFYKLQFIYQKEADESKAVLQKQIDQLQVSQDTIKMELQHSHEEQMQSVQQQHDQSMEELRKSFTQQLESSYESFKKADDALKAQVQVLAQENADLMKKQNLAESPDSHTVYLEQELESLKVVLDIKNKQIHEQKTMMIEIDKLLEKNVKLDESLKKVQQENEDLKARMERYAALSRQWSTENTMLQESLQKESNVNKRLSMEIEELLWKLHNGEAGSPQKLSHSSDTCSVFPLNPR
nr:microtubule-associated tumor suppressor 1 homolog [Nerophis lumbriciformis]